MTTFFVDLWHDLREKRLWPVAVGLLAAIVAVPVVLFKPASDAAPPSVAAPKDPANALPVVSVDAAPLMGSRLQAFSASEKNPFKPLKDLAKATDSGAGGSGSGTGGSGSGSGGSGSGSFGGGAGSNGTGSGGGSPSGSTPGGSTPGGSTPGGTTKTTRWFHWTADFSFGETGAKAKTHKGISSFTLLPDEQTPVVVFMGVGADHKSALFFVSDPGFDAQGEGECNTDTACQFVILNLSDTGDEETFSALDGSVSYDVKLLAIHREELGTGTNPPAPPAPKNGKAAAATGDGVATATEATQAVLPAAFAGGPGVAREQVR